MRGMMRGTGGYKTRGLQKHSAHHIQGIKYVLKNGQKLHDDILKYFQNPSNPPLTIEDFRSKWSYPLYYMPIKLAVSLYHAVSVGKDGMVRLREKGNYNDSGIALCTISGNKLVSEVFGKI